MRSALSYLSLLLLLGVACSSCMGPSRTQGLPRRSIGSLKLLDTFSFAPGMRFHETVVGGLSGIDYVPQKNIYYLICDDPSAFSPARFYTARIQLSEQGIDTVIFVDVNTVLNPDGRPYADITKDRTHSADLESMRYNPVRDELIRGSEGQRVATPGKEQFQQPDLVMMERDGSWRDSFRLPPNIRINTTAYGIRHNMAFEGLTFLKDYREVLLSIEDALYQDGPSGGLGDTTAWTRMIRFSRDRKKAIAQYAYRTDAVPIAPVPAGAFRVNGIPDILAVNDAEILVMERAWSTGELQHHVRIYVADLKHASDVSGILSLSSNPPKRPMSKELLLDFDSLGFYIDNVEGMTWGPVLPNGNKTLLCVSDDNFMSRQRSQFFLFEVLPGK